MDDDNFAPVSRQRLKSWKEYEQNEEIPLILSEGLLPIRFRGAENEDHEDKHNFLLKYCNENPTILYNGVAKATEQEDMYALEREELEEKVFGYNSAAEMNFQITILKEQDYEGALRFYYDDGSNELTKAIRLTNRTTVEELIPTLIGKFSLKTDPKLYSLFEVQNTEAGHVLLYNEECPLARAISNKKVPRFVLRESASQLAIKPEDSISQYSSTKKDKRKKLFRLSGLGEKGENKKKGKGTDEVSKTNKKKEKAEYKKQFSENKENIEELTYTVKSDQSDVSIDDIFAEWDQEEDKTNFNGLKEAPVYAEINSKQNRIDSRSSQISVEPVSPHTVDRGPIEKTGVDISRTLSFSNSSIFYEQDNDGNVNYKRKRDKKKLSATKSDANESQEKRSKSFSKMLKPKKKRVDTSHITELSTNKLTPGILKVFGDHVSKGSNYKAVRVSTISTAQEVVRMALERYGFDNAQPKDYVLCDVVGTFIQPNSESPKFNSKKQSKQKKSESAEEDQPTWNMEYIRAVNDNEKPLILQSLWKPTGGRARRFELRRRVDVENSCFFINTAEGPGRRSSETSLFEDSELSSANNSMGNLPKVDGAPLSPHPKANKSRQVDESINQAPLYTPYLLLLQGLKNTADALVHKLDDPTLVVGCYIEGEAKQCGLALHSPDILLPHCWLYKKVKLEENNGETNLDDITFAVFLEPADSAEVTINGKHVTSTTALKHGHLVGFGKSYLFLFKDPTQEAYPFHWLEYVAKNENSNWTGNNAAVRNESVQVVNAEGTTEESDSESEVSSSDDEEEDKRYLAPRKHVEKSALQIEYDINEEDNILHMIIDISDEELGDFKLTPAYFFMMVIEHSAATFTEIQTRKLLLKISSGLQGIAWEKTKEIGKQSAVKDDDPVETLARLLPDLKPVLLWMACAIEMLHFLQGKLDKYLLSRSKVTTTKEALISADEELLTVLEEVIMFTFQQTVYHLTKVLYAALPAIIEVNPFKSGEENEQANGSTVHPAVEKITTIFTNILESTQEYQVHQHITMQLFAYLFFFSNASLFNSLMERGAGGSFYRWTKGVQMRANLDALEDWAQANGLASQFEKYMGKAMSAVDLLSCPKVQLTQMDWNTMRTEYNLLNPAQLQQLLAEYHLGGGPRPRSWYPPPDQVEPALRSSEVLESFATHPPLMLPSNNFILDLDSKPDNEKFTLFFNLIRTRGNEAEKTKVEEVPPEEVLSPPASAMKNKRQRTRSSIDLGDVEEAIQVKQENVVESAPEINFEAPKPRVHFETDTDNTDTEEKPMQRPSSIKSIQVHSKKTTKVTITSRSTSNASKNVSIVTNGGENHVVMVNGDRNGEEGGQVGEVILVDLVRGSKGLGLGLIDGMFTSLQSNGIYIRTVVPETPASKDPRLRMGDRLLAVNGNTLVGSDYNTAMDLIKKAGNRLSFLIQKSDDNTVKQVLSTLA